MKIWSRKFLFLLLVTGMILVKANLASAQESDFVSADTTDIVFDEDELSDWLNEHAGIGGTVRLGEVVVITKYIPIDADEASPVIIDTGSFGLVFDGNAIGSNEFIQITGEGTEVPVVDVLRAGGDLYWQLSWNNILMTLNVTATGRDGIGGVAMRILAKDRKPLSLYQLTMQGVIRSYGENAIGLWLDVPMSAYCYNVEVLGENSVGVYAPNGAELYYCKLAADGTGARAVAGENLMLDTCSAIPEPPDIPNVRRRVLESSFERLYVPIPQYQYPYMLPVILDLFLSGGEDDSEVSRLFFDQLGL